MTRMEGLSRTETKNETNTKYNVKFSALSSWRLVQLERFSMGPTVCVK